MSDSVNYTPRSDLKMLVDEANLIQTPLVAPILAPEVQVSQPSAKAASLPKGATSRVPYETKRNLDGTFNQGSLDLSNVEYFTEEHGWDQRLDQVQRLLNLEYFDLEVLHSQIAKAMLLLNRELRVAADYENETNYGANVVTASEYWDDPDVADPFTDLEDVAVKAKALFGMGLGALRMTIRDTTLRKVMRSTALSARAVYTINLDKMDINMQAEYLRQVLGLGSVVVLNGIYNASGIDIPAVFTDIWNEDLATITYPGSGSSIALPGFCKQPVWTPYSRDYNMYSYVNIINKSTTIHVEEYRGLKTDYTYGVLLKGLVTP